MRITKALYGGLDVLDKVKSSIKNNSLMIVASNELFGDPKPGKQKYLELTINDKDYLIQENQKFIFPPKSHRLGIFYTNNNSITASYCVKNLYKFKKINPKYIDIITCSWYKLYNNPFTEIESINKIPSHLSIILQILQMLYRVQVLKKYQYVAFLEHDVLYPEDYFVFEDFDHGYSLLNTNYIGLCDRGFQNKNHIDIALHQIIMKFDDAIEHFNDLMRQIITNQFKVLEPRKLIWRECINPSIHINHGHHFTNHHNIYSKQTYTDHDYWGNGAELWQNILNFNKN